MGHHTGDGASCRDETSYSGWDIIQGMGHHAVMIHHAGMRHHTVDETCRGCGYGSCLVTFGCLVCQLTVSGMSFLIN